MLAIQIELMLVDCHGPHRTDQGWMSVPGVDGSVTYTKRPSTHRYSDKRNRTIHSLNTSDKFLSKLDVRFIFAVGICTL